jgi:hypothetical protein
MLGEFQEPKKIIKVQGPSCERCGNTEYKVADMVYLESLDSFISVSHMLSLTS